MMKRCGIHTVGWVLVVIGGLNWGLVGAFKFNLVEAILGSWPLVVRVVYILVGLAAIFSLLQSQCKGCKASA